MDSAEEQRYLRALESEVDPSLQKDRNELCAPGSGQWFFQHPCYEAFLAAKGPQLLFITAEAGGGKSTLMKTLVDGRLAAPDAPLLAFFFFKDDTTALRSYEEALTSMIHQLLVQDKTLIKHVKPYCDQFGGGLKQNAGVLWKALVEVVRHSKRDVLCVIDALDECESAGRKGAMADLKTFFRDRAYMDAPVKFVISSRPYQDDNASYDDLFDTTADNIRHLAGENARVAADLRRVIQIKTEALAQRRGLDRSTQERIIETLMLQNKQTRSFLAIRMSFELLEHDVDLVAGVTEPTLTKILDRTPGSLADQFDEMLNRSTDAQCAHKIFCVILASRKTIKIDELKVMYALIKSLDASNKEERSHEDMVEQHLENEDFKRRIRTTCGLFITFVGNSVHLFHQTAREHLVKHTRTPEENYPRPSTISYLHTNQVPGTAAVSTWRQSISLPYANLVCADLCLRIITLETSPTWPMEAFDSIEAGNQCHQDINAFVSTRPGIVYASLNWYEHYQVARAEGHKLFDNSEHMAIIDLSMPQFWSWFLIVADYICGNTYYCDSYKAKIWPFSTIWSTYKSSTEDSGIGYFLRDFCVSKMFPMDHTVSMLLEKTPSSISQEDGPQDEGVSWKVANGFQLIDRFHSAYGEYKFTSSVQAAKAIENENAYQAAAFLDATSSHQLIWASILIAAPYALEQALASVEDCSWLRDIPGHMIHRRGTWSGYSSATGSELRESRHEKWEHAYPPSFVPIFRSNTLPSSPELFNVLANWVDKARDKSDTAHQIWEAGGFIPPMLASRLVAAGVPVDKELWRDHRTALQIAATFWEHDTVQKLLALGADPARCTDNGYNALHWFSNDEKLYLGEPTGLRDRDSDILRYKYRRNSIASSIQAMVRSSSDRDGLLNQACHRGKTPLMHAVQSTRSSSTAVRVLLEEGALVNMRTAQSPPSSSAATKDLSEEWVLVKSRDASMRTALARFFRNPRFGGSSVSILKHLLSYGADIQDIDKKHRSALDYWADHIMSIQLSHLYPGYNIYNQTFDALANAGSPEILVKQLASLNIPLVVASLLGNTQLCAALLASGANVNQYKFEKDSQLIHNSGTVSEDLQDLGWDPLMVALHARAYITAILLMENGAGVEKAVKRRKRTKRNKYSVMKGGVTPLHLVLVAKQRQYWYGSRINPREFSADRGFCSLQEAAQRDGKAPPDKKDRQQKIEDLMYMQMAHDKGDQGEDLSDPEYEKVRDNVANDWRGANLLPYDITANIIPSFRLRDGPLINTVTDRNLSTASRQEALVRYMLSKGASCNACTMQMITPLQLATKEQLASIVKALLEYGADPNIATSEGATPLMIAAELGNREITECLLNAGADVNAQLNVKEPSKCKCRNFIDWGCYTFYSCEVPLTALAIAADHRHPEVVKLLLHAGADPNLRIIHHVHGRVPSKKEVRKARGIRPEAGNESDSDSDPEPAQWKGLIAVGTALTFAIGECRDLLLSFKATQQDSSEECDCLIESKPPRDITAWSDNEYGSSSGTEKSDS